MHLTAEKRQAKLTEWMNEEAKPMSERAKEEALQTEIRNRLREVVDSYNGEWATAGGLVFLLKQKYPHLANLKTSKGLPAINNKNVSEYLKTMGLKTKKIPSQFYLCKKIFAEV